MAELILRVKAPHAAFWAYTMGWRRTSLVMPPSTAYGLALNLANEPMESDLPLDIAVGLCRPPQDCRKGTLFQQLHMASQQKGAIDKLGFKQSIQPFRREFLTDYDGVVAVRGDDSVVEQVARGILGEGDSLFAGDSDCFITHLNAVTDVPAYWFVRDPAGRSRWLERLTIRVNRENPTKTIREAFVPTTEPSVIPPEMAWTQPYRTS